MKKLKYEILIILFFVLSRLPTLGHDNFTTDTWKWKSRSYDFGSGVFGLDFQKTLQKYHPGVTLMWTGATGIKIYNVSYSLLNGTDPPDNNISTVFELDFVQKLLMVLVISVGLAFVFYPIKNIFGLTSAFLAVIAISFEPYYIALTRVFHLEGLLSIFMLVSVVWLYWFIDDGGHKKLLVSAVFGGLAVLTKTTALFLIPFTILMLTVASLTKEGVAEGVVEVLSCRLRLLLSLKNIFTRFFLWAVAFSIIVFSLWPALWVDPQGVYKAIYKGVAVVGIEREHIQYYFGKLVEDPGPAFYPVVFLYKSSPWLLIGIVGLVFIAGRISAKKKQFVLFLLIYSLLYLLMLSVPTKKLDRYIVPPLVSFAVISSFFYIWLWERVKINPVYKFLIMFTPVFVSAVYVHPDYLSYYNPLTGGLKNGIRALEPKWLIGERETLNYFKNIQEIRKFQKSDNTSLEGLIKEKKVNNILVVGFQEKYYTQIWPFFREIGAWAVIEDITAQSQYAGYFVYPVWNDTSNKEDRFELQYDGSIYIRGIEVYKVYRRQ
jgi:hypothetical protein